MENFNMRQMRPGTPSNGAGAAGPEAAKPNGHGTVSGSELMVRSILAAAHMQYEGGNLGAARDFLILLEPLKAHTSDTLLALGNIHYQLKEYEPAGTAYGRAAGLAPEDASLQAALARTCLKLEDVKGFEGYLGRALQLDPANWDALKLLADANRTAGHWEDAAQAYGQLVRQQPENIEVLLALAKSFYELGDRNTAAECLNRVLILEPGNQLARENLSTLEGAHSSGAVPAHALSQPHSALSNPPAKPPPKESSLGDGPAPEATPEMAGRWVKEAEAAYARKDLAAAAKALEQAVQCDPEAVPLLVALANTLFQLGRNPEALSYYQAASARQPESVDILVRLAATATRCQDVGLFERALGRALELEPGNLNAVRLLADLNFEASRFDAALDQYRRVLQQSPRDIEVLLRLGRCEYESGRLEEARRIFQTAADFDPSSEIARDNLKVVSGKLARQSADKLPQPPQINWGDVGAKLARLRLTPPPAARS